MATLATYTQYYTDAASGSRLVDSVCVGFNRTRFEHKKRASRYSTTVVLTTISSIYDNTEYLYGGRNLPHCAVGHAGFLLG